jgi:hypothetical protein
MWDELGLSLRAGGPNYHTTPKVEYELEKEGSGMNRRDGHGSWSSYNFMERKHWRRNLKDNSPLGK